MGEPRDFAASSIAVHDIFLRRANDHRFGFGHGGEREGSIAGGDRLLDLSYRAAQARAACPIDHGTTRALPCSLFGGFCIGHALRWSLVKRRL
jgi:hypothetical protein